MAINYTLKDNESIEAKVTFLRIAPNGKRQTLDDIFTKLSDLSWINRMTPPALHKSFEVRAKRTLDKLVEIINNSATLPIVDAVSFSRMAFGKNHDLMDKKSLCFEGTIFDDDPLLQTNRDFLIFLENNVKEIE